MDVYRNMIRPDAPQGTLVWLGRALTVSFVVAGGLIAPSYRAGRGVRLIQQDRLCPQNPLLHSESYWQIVFPMNHLSDTAPSRWLATPAA
jgi:hypothetical protein